MTGCHPDKFCHLRMTSRPPKSCFRADWVEVFTAAVLHDCDKSRNVTLYCFVPIYPIWTPLSFDDRSAAFSWGYWRVQ